MAVKFTNNAKTTLASGITSTATSATVVDGSVFPTLGAGEYFYCTFDDTTNNEIVKVTARSGNTLTIVRGVDNTTARAFSSGDAAELRATAGLLTDIQENIAAKSANQTVYNTTTASSATDYDIGIDPSVEANAMVFLNGVMQHHDTFSFSGSTLTFDTAPSDGMALEVIVDNLINLQSSNLTVDTFTAADVGGSPQTDFTLSDSPAAETNLIVFVDGVFQDQDAYTISSNVLTMTDGVVADRVVTVYVINPVNIGTPSDGTVTSAKLSGNITMPANLTVTGDVAFDSPTFVVDNANSRVGIGTAAPTTLLDIVGDVKMSAGLQVSGIDYPTSDGTNGQVLTTDGAGTLSFSTISGYTDSDVESYLDSGVSTPTFSTATVTGDLTVDTNTLYVDSTNNRVGIGTTSINANAKLHVQGTGDSQILVYETGTSPYTATLKLASQSTTDYGANVQYTSGAEQLTIENFGRSINGTAQGSIRFRTKVGNSSMQEVLHINGYTGNVGIGTSSPARSPLHLATSGTDYCQVHMTNGTSGSTSSDGLTLFTNGTDAGLMQRENSYLLFGTNDTERLRIDSSGNLLVGGTSTSVWQGAAGKKFIVSGSQNTVSSLQTSTTAIDQGGIYDAYSTAVTSGSPALGSIAFLRSNTSTTACSSYTAFYTNNAGSAGERMRISGQQLIIGNTSAVNTTTGLDVNNLQNGISSKFNSTYGTSFMGYSGSDLGLLFYGAKTNGAQTVQIEADGDIKNTNNSYGALSDVKLKENIVDANPQLDKLKQVQVRNYNLIGEELKQIGMVAQELETIYPNLVTEIIDRDENAQPLETTTKTIKYSVFVPILIKAMQEQQTIIDDLKARIETLENN